jgi:peptidase E
MGGGGFSSSPGDPELDRYVLDVAGGSRPSICLLPTASGDPDEQIARFYRAYAHLDCEPSHISLFRLATHPIDLAATLLSQHVIYVGGGSLLNLLAVWRAHDIDAVLREAWQRGVVLCGLSAGSMCWFDAGVTKSTGPPRPARGLGFLPASNSVHFDTELERRPCFRDAVRTRVVPPGYGVDDGVALLFAGTDLVEAVSQRGTSGARWVQAVGDEVTETPLNITRLSSQRAGDKTPLSIVEYRASRRHAATLGAPLARRLAQRRE